MLKEINTGSNVNLHNNDSNWKSIDRFLQAALHDPVINKKVISILKLDSYPRQIVLSNWLEELRLQHAPGKLIETLSCLFDEKIARQVLEFINRQN